MNKCLTCGIPATKHFTSITTDPVSGEKKKVAVHLCSNEACAKSQALDLPELDDLFAALCPHGEVKSTRKSKETCRCCGCWLGPPPVADKCSTCRDGVIEFPQAKPISL